MVDKSRIRVIIQEYKQLSLIRWLPVLFLILLVFFYYSHCSIEEAKGQYYFGRRIFALFVPFFGTIWTLFLIQRHVNKRDSGLYLIYRRNHWGSLISSIILYQICIWITCGIILQIDDYLGKGIYDILLISILMQSVAYAIAFLLQSSEITFFILIAYQFYNCLSYKEHHTWLCWYRYEIEFADWFRTIFLKLLLVVFLLRLVSFLVCKYIRKGAY